MTLTVPHIFKPKEPAASAAVNENFATVLADIEGISAAAAGTDLYQAGVVVQTDWLHSTSVITGGTGEVELVNDGGAAWLPGPAGGIVRTFTPVATYKGLKPPLLPAPGGWRCVGIELTASGNEAVLSLVSGTEQASEALALANSPAVTAGKMRLHDIPLLNTAGVYSKGTRRDRRPWARGFMGHQRYEESTISFTAEQAIEPTGLSMRAELGGGPIRVFCQIGSVSLPENSNLHLGFTVDGAVFIPKAPVAPTFGPAANSPSVSAVAQGAPAAGSHLIRPTVSCNSGTGKIFATTAPVIFIVEEIMRGNAINGTV